MIETADLPALKELIGKPASRVEAEAGVAAVRH